MSLIVTTFTEYCIVFFNIVSVNEMSTINKGYIRLQTRICSTQFLLVTHIYSLCSNRMAYLNLFGKNVHHYMFCDSWSK